MRSAILSADLRDLPFIARALLDGVHNLMREARRPVLRTGDHVTDRPGLAAKLGVELAEIEAHLPSLLTRRLLMEEDDGALYSPLLVAAEVKRRERAERRRLVEESAAQAGEVISPRVAAARANGALGGRPRLHPDSVAGQAQIPLLRVMPDARDSSLGSGVGSGVGSSPITHVGFSSASALAEAQTQTLFQEEQRVPSTPARADASEVETQENPAARHTGQAQPGQTYIVADVARELMEVAGIARPPNSQDLSTTHRWLLALPLAAIRNVVGAVGAAAKVKKVEIGHLGYFSQAMAEAIVVQAGGSASGLHAAAAPAANDPRLRPRQADESEAAFERRQAGYSLTLPERKPGEGEYTYRRRVRSKFEVTNIVAATKGLPPLDWAAIAAEAGVPEDEEAA